MRRWDGFNWWLIVWLALVLGGVNTAWAAAADGAAARIGALQQQLDALKQQVTQTQDAKQLMLLSGDSEEIIAASQEIALQLNDALEPVLTQLNVLGPAQNTGQPNEAPEVLDQRNNLTRQRESLEKNLDQTKALEKNAQLLMVQIASLRRDILKEQLTLNNGSVFSYAFWRPVIQPSSYDVRQYGRFWQDVSNAVAQAFSGPWLAGTLCYLALLCALPVTYRRLVRAVTWMTPKIIPHGRLIRSFYSVMVVLVNVALAGLMAWIVSLMLTRLPVASEQLKQFFTEWLSMCLFMAQWLGVGNALLSLEKPSWRLTALSDEVAGVIRPFQIGIVGVIFLSGTLDLSNSSAGVSVSISMASSALAILLLIACAGAMTWRINHAFSPATQREHSDGPQHPPLVILLHTLVLIFCAVVLIALGLGYITFARYLVYKFMWGILVVCCTFLLVRLWEDLCSALFSPEHRMGKSLQALLKLQDRHLAIIDVLLSGIGRVLLILVALVSILNGTFDSTALVELVKKIVELWGGAGLGQLNIVPSNIINAALVLVGGGFLIHRGRRWLEEKFFPRTQVDKGMQASLIMLFTNMGYAVIVVLTLSSLGVKWNSLAWIVSALSVGIGFGLQEIVKNFISGLILLTERPVRVGDLVSISGIEGDIKRINVRATEIQLGDRSTVIVPNSQFISQNVRNATMGNAQGVVTIALTYPLDVDPMRVREILLQVFVQNEAILDAPAPSVSLTQLSADGIQISATGYVSSPRMISSTKSDLLFTILSQLRQHGINISVPQTIVLKKDDSE